MEANGQRAAIEDEADVIRAMSRVEPLRVVSGASEGEGANLRGVTLVVSPLVLRLPLEGVVDLDAEGERLRSELADCARNLERVENAGVEPQLPAKRPAPTWWKTKKPVCLNSATASSASTKSWRNWGGRQSPWQYWIARLSTIGVAYGRSKYNLRY